jgi:ABC-type uncharacterized transport system involved in gliding motility auxiliary subunit
VVGVLVAAVLFVAGNLLLDASVRSARLDLTEHGLFTLSAGTRATIAAIDEPIVLHLFFSERLGREVPIYAAYGRRVRELVRELVTVANGKIKLHEHDPEPFSTAEDQAVALGVQGIPIDQAGELTYFGMAGVNTVDDVEVIPFFQPDRESLLEYDLVELIHTLSDAEPTVLGVLSSLPLLGDMGARLQGRPSPQWALARELTTGFKVMNLPQSFDQLPPEIDVLLIVHPRELGDREQYEIEQFLFRGGRAVMFVDPKSEEPTAMMSVGPDEASSSTRGLSRLFQHWRIDVPEGRLLADRELAWRVNAGTAQQVIPVDYLVWLAVEKDYLQASDPITAHLPVVNVGSAGFIQRSVDSPLDLEPLMVSSPISGSVPVEMLAGLRPNLRALVARFVPDPNTYVIAARLSGALTSAFADGPPARTVPLTSAERSENPERAQLMTSPTPVKLVLVADSDLLQDRMWLRVQRFFGREVPRPFAGNATFVVNAVENLAGSDELTALRSRGVSQRPFDRVNELRRRVEAVLHEKEQALKERLEATKAKIESLQGVRSKPNPTTGEVEVEVQLSTTERAQVEALRTGMLAIRAELRDVQHGLRKDVDALETKMQLANIVLVPLIVAVVAGTLGTLRVMRRRRRVLAG